MRTIKSISLLKNSEKIKEAKIKMYLDFLSDDEFLLFCKELVENNIKMPDILSVTKYILSENFVSDKVIHYLKNREKTSKRFPDIKDIQVRLNLSKSDALLFIEEYKKKKRLNKEGFILRYGEEEGLKRFKKFQETSSIPSQDKWFQDRYGDNWKEIKKNTFQSRSRYSKTFWIKRGFSEEDAILNVSKIQKNNAGVHREFWKNKGFSEEEIDVIINKINEKKKNHSRNRKYLKDTYGDAWESIYNKNQEKYRKKMERKKVWIPLDLKEDFYKYRLLCNFYTNESIDKYKLKDLEKRSHQFHIDHKYSIKQGFLDNIEAKIIGSIVNLEILPNYKNSKKRAKCSITKEELLTLYKELQDEDKKD